MACVLVLGLSWWLSESTNDKVRSGIRSALEAVHQSTARSVDDWLTSIDQEASAWARSPLVRGLLSRPPTGGGTGARTEARELLAPLRGLTGVAGYFVVDSKGHVVASDDAGLLSRAPAREFGKRWSPR